MNILALSFDTNLLSDQTKSGSARDRFRMYAEILNERAPGSYIDVVVRTSRQQRAKPRALHDNLLVHPTNSASGTFILDVYRLAGRLIRERDVALVTTQTPFTDGLVGYWLKRRYGVKLVPRLHKGILDDPFWLAEHPANTWRRLIGKFVLRRSDGVRVVSERAREWVLAQTGLPPDLVLNNPDSTPLVGMPTPEHPRKDNQLLFVGRLTFQKGIDVLLRAFALVLRHIPECQLAIVGEGEERTRLQQVAHQLGVSQKVRWYGQVAHHVLPQLFASASVFVLPSRYESFGKVIVEAMNFGVPVVSTDTDGAIEIIRDGYNGLIVPKNKELEMASKIVFLLTHPEEAKRMGETARREVQQRYDPYALCSIWVNFWIKLVNSNA